LLKKQKLLEVFEEVLERLESAETYVLDHTWCIGDEYNHDVLKKEIQEYKQEFREALES